MDSAGGRQKRSSYTALSQPPVSRVRVCRRGRRERGRPAMDRRPSPTHRATHQVGIGGQSARLFAPRPPPACTGDGQRRQFDASRLRPREASSFFLFPTFFFLPPRFFSPAAHNAVPVRRALDRRVRSLTLRRSLTRASGHTRSPHPRLALFCSRLSRFFSRTHTGGIYIVQPSLFGSRQFSGESSTRPVERGRCRRSSDTP